ncbi:UPF0755 protein [Spirosomataceae bacterium TFI 002]|nr:UPF0755 protein [Spirosomataceae bacterium TFI 002]
MKKKNIIAFALVIVTTLVASFSFYFWQVAKSPNLHVDGQKDFVLYIPKGSNYEGVVDSLRAHKMITDDISFGFLSKFMKYRDNIKPGRYLIPPNSGNKEILSKLRAGNQDAVKLTFNNVRLKEDLIEKIGTKLSFDGDDLLSLLNDEAVCEEYGFNKNTIMSMFLPDTYFIYWTLTPKEFMERMKYEYDKFWTEERLAKANAINLTPVEVATMASIVQSETNKKDEMPRVAGVYVNRMRVGMPLQADPTVKFAVGDFSIKRVLKVHTQIDSPYNTYRYGGLPPGPIALPERVALDAVLGYEKHNYTYFCAREDFSGYHNFATDLTGHMVNARTYQAALNARGIK